MQPVSETSALPFISDEEREQMQRHVRQMLQEAPKSGATSAEASVRIDVGYTVSVRMGEVETVEYHRDKGLGLTVYKGQCQGSSSTTDFSDASLRRALKAALDIAAVTGDDPFSGLAEADLMARHYPNIPLYFPWHLGVEDAIRLAVQCESQARAFDARIKNSEGASVTNVVSFYVYGNSHGFLGSYSTSSHHLSCAVVAGEGEGMQRDYYYTVARDPEDLESSEQVAIKAAERTVRRLGAFRIPTGKIPVLFSAEVARGLLGHFVSAISGGNLYRRASFLLDSLGEAVFSKNITIREEPHLPKGMASAPFDHEGVATQSRVLVDEGVLKGYVLGSYSARKLGMKTTGNAGGIHNLVVVPGEASWEALLQKMHRGLVVTEVMGQGVNTVTGDYSRGVAGFWVENGVIQHPVEGVTIAGNLKDMLRQIVAVGNDVDLRGTIRTGSILLEAMTVAGI